MKPDRVRVSSYALLSDADRMLLCRISSQVPNAAGKWTLPGGGLDFGEDPERAVVREVREETGLEIKVDRVAEVDSQLFDFSDERIHVVRILYHAEVTGGSLRHESEGSTDQAAWHTRDEAWSLPLVEVARLGLSILFDRSRQSAPMTRRRARRLRALGLLQLFSLSAAVWAHGGVNGEGLVVDAAVCAQAAWSIAKVHDRLPGTEGLRLEPKGEFQLRGKGKGVRLFALTGAPEAILSPTDA